MPFDLKTAIRFDFGKVSHLSSVGLDVTVAHDTAPAATGARQKQHG